MAYEKRHNRAERVAVEETKDCLDSAETAFDLLTWRECRRNGHGDGVHSATAGRVPSSTVTALAPV